MAQSALTDDVDTSNTTARTLDMPTFWSKPTMYPNTSVDKWKDEFIVSLYAKTMIEVHEVLTFRREPRQFTPGEEAPPTDRVETKTQEEQRLDRNEKRADEAKQLFDADWKFWKESSASGLNLTAANQRAKSILWIMLGTEGKRRYKQKLPYIKVAELTFGELWAQLDDVFLIKRNRTVDRVAFFSRRQTADETMEHFHATLTAMAAKCYLKDLEQELIRDLFITNIRDLDLQRKFFSKEYDPAKVLEIALAWERGAFDQKKLATMKAPPAASPLLPGSLDPAPKVDPATGDATTATQSVKMEPIGAVQQNSDRGPRKPANCRNCGNQFGQGHAKRCPARGQTCRNCGKDNHFARVCRSSASQTDRSATSTPRPPHTGDKKERPKRMPYIEQSVDYDEPLDRSSHVHAIVTSEREDGELPTSVEYTDVLELDAGPPDWDEYGVLAVSQKKGTPRYTIQLQIGSSRFEFMVDTGSPTSFVDNNTATAILRAAGPSATLRHLTPSEKLENYSDFNGNPVPKCMVLEANVSCTEGALTHASFYVLTTRNTRCLLLGANLLPALGIALVQHNPLPTELNMGKTVHNIVSSPHSTFSQWAETQFPELFRRTGRFTNHIVKTKFKTPFTATQQKCRRIPLALQNHVATEIERLIAEGHVARLQQCTDDQSVSPVVITVKRDGTLKLALDSKELNKMVCKNKYQMPNIDNLMDRIADIIHSERHGTVWFSSIDLRYAYGQLLLHPKTSRQCNFNLVGGAATGTYRFLTGFYGLADMPAEFQQAIDRDLTGVRSANAFIDDILICTKGTLEAHRAEVYNVLQKLNLAGVDLNQRK